MNENRTELNLPQLLFKAYIEMYEETTSGYPHNILTWDVVDNKTKKCWEAVADAALSWFDDHERDLWEKMR